MRIEKSSDSRALAIATIVMGIIAGASSGLLSIVLDATERVFFHFTETNAIPVAFSATPLNRLLAPIIGALIVSVVWYFMQLHYRPVKLGKAVDGEKMPMGATIMHVTAQVFYVGTGGSIGRELAPREAGAMWAQSWIRLGDQIGWLKLAPEDRRLLIAAAAGAGFAGVYIAPITGAMFCLEILYKKIDKKAVIVSLTMAAIATMVGAIVKGWQPYYLVASRQFSLRLIPFVVIVAPLMGFLGTWYKRLIGRASALRVKDRRIFITMPLAGALTGAVACFFPRNHGEWPGRGPDGNQCDQCFSFGSCFTAVRLFCQRAGYFGNNQWWRLWWDTDAINCHGFVFRRTVRDDFYSGNAWRTVDAVCCLRGSLFSWQLLSRHH